MPLINQTFSQLITFTRASSATYVDARGLIQSASTNVPRFDYNPSTLAPRGILIEEQRTNLFLYSQEFNNIYWTLDTSTISANAIAAPDGTTTADRLVVNNGASGGSINRSLTVLNATAHTLSCFVKSDGVVNWVQFVATSATGVSPARLWCNISTGVLGTNNGGFTNASVTSFGNGWYRITATYTTASTSSVYYFANADADNVNSYAGNGVNGAYFWGAQLEAGSFATSYIPTVASQVTRSADLASLNALSSWFNATEGTLFANYDQNSSTQSGGSLFVQSDGTNNNRILLTADGASSGTIQPGLYVTDTSVAQVAIVAGTGTINSTNKLAAAYKVNDFAASFNGAASVTDSVGTVPFVDRSYIGAGATGTSGFINGHIRRIVFYPSRLSNANLQTITA